ncbi:hypothetical protein RHOFW104T7_14435 [Rhodanobacter thiooxydans]|uniref:Uncharacterized protein n=1 Tax=Rhodanobacter thiooxydans TaxID=416169 RepID=A0A154QGJ7_9GAMM|nr:hypothetical protein UUA_00310 [Rhodanobacter thiooxydans LCS2]KZC23369.1 hypothetical protein RHOFW104T7_14435 [Rhodanobacter thiooxydans]
MCTDRLLGTAREPRPDYPAIGLQSAEIAGRHRGFAGHSARPIESGEATWSHSGCRNGGPRYRDMQAFHPLKCADAHEKARVRCPGFSAGDTTDNLSSEHRD